MASSKSKSSATPKDRPPAEQVARELYKQQFGTTKPDAELPPAADVNPEAPLGGRVDPTKPNRSDDRLVAAPADETTTKAKKED